MDETALRSFTAKAISRSSPQLRRRCLKALIEAIRSPRSSPSLKIYACGQIRIFIGGKDLEDLVEEGVNAVYDVCEDQDRDVRIKGYEAIVGVSDAKRELCRRNVDVLIQLLQADDTLEHAQISLSLRRHLSLEPHATLGVTSEQLLPTPSALDENESHLRVLVIQWLLEPETLRILLVPKTLSGNEAAKWYQVILQMLPSLSDTPSLICSLVQKMLRHVPPFAHNPHLLVSDLFTLATNHKSLIQPILPLLPSLLLPESPHSLLQLYSNSLLTSKDFLISTSGMEKDKLVIVCCLADSLQSLQSLDNEEANEMKLQIATGSSQFISALLNSRKSNSDSLQLNLKKSVITLLENITWAIQHDWRLSSSDLVPILERLSSSPEGKDIEGTIKSVQALLPVKAVSPVKPPPLGPPLAAKLPAKPTATPVPLKRKGTAILDCQPFVEGQEGKETRKRPRTSADGARPPSLFARMDASIATASSGRHPAQTPRPTSKAGIAIKGARARSEKKNHAQGRSNGFSIKGAASRDIQNDGRPKKRVSSGGSLLGRLG